MSRKGKHDVSPIVRGAFLEALEKIKREEGKGFSTIIKEWIEKDGIGPVLQAVSRYTVKESKVDADVTTTFLQILAQVSDEEIEELEEEPRPVRH